MNIKKLLLVFYVLSFCICLSAQDHATALSFNKRWVLNNVSEKTDLSSDPVLRQSDNNGSQSLLYECPLEIYNEGNTTFLKLQNGETLEVFSVSVQENKLILMPVPGYQNIYTWEVKDGALLLYLEPKPGQQDSADGHQYTFKYLQE